MRALFTLNGSSGRNSYDRGRDKSDWSKTFSNLNFDLSGSHRNGFGEDDVETVDLYGHGDSNDKKSKGKSKKRNDKKSSGASLGLSSIVQRVSNSASNGQSSNGSYAKVTTTSDDDEDVENPFNRGS
jgi:hypothetical protein